MVVVAVYSPNILEDGPGRETAGRIAVTRVGRVSIPRALLFELDEGYVPFADTSEASAALRALVEAELRYCGTG